MNKLLIDSSFIIALFRKNDSLNKKASDNKNILINNKCYITEGILGEVITILGQKTKNILLIREIYNYIKDNFIILNELEINMYNDNVFSIFEKYNKNKFRVGFIDCSQVVVYNNYSLDYVVSFDNAFNIFEEIKLFNLE